MLRHTLEDVPRKNKGCADTDQLQSVFHRLHPCHNETARHHTERDEALNRTQYLLVIFGPCQNKGRQKPVVAHFCKEVDAGHKQDQTQQYGVAAQKAKAFRAGFPEWFILPFFCALNLWDPDEKQQNDERYGKAAKIADQDDLQPLES